MALTAEQTVALENAQSNIDQAQQFIADSEAVIANANNAIVSAQASIDFATSQLDDPDLPQDRRVFYEANIEADLKVIASNEQIIQAQTQSIVENQSVISQNQEVINTIDSTATATTSAAPVTDAAQSQGTTTDPAVTPGEINLGPAPVSPVNAGGRQSRDDEGNLLPGWAFSEELGDYYVGDGYVAPETLTSAVASRTQAQKENARQQQTLQARQNTPSSADWRVKISLAQGSDYLYNTPANAGGPGILGPLNATQGVIFPYTPSIETSYQAKYDMNDLVHSNYRGYFYKNSMVNDIQIRGTFTAQDTKEAQYLLAVIHFFRSVTKMFYGKDGQAGTPPPLVYLSAYGQYQFSNHPCVVSSFTYSLPTDVDYIRADGFNNIGVNMENRNSRSSGPGPSGALATIGRLLNSGLFNGSLPNTPSPSAVVQNIFNTNATNSTYVPTKMDISVSLSPIQTRDQISKQFSLKGFANGDLLKKGFW